jgi:DNA-directed RNA polymerase specialized sigma24 family protein
VGIISRSTFDTGVRLAGVDNEAAFRAFVERVEPDLRRALVATFGYDRGGDAVAESLAFAWERWDRVAEIGNPIAYLYKVGRSKTRSRRERATYDSPSDPEPLYEPGLAAAMSSLPERQRLAVFLAHGLGWTHSEVAELMGIRRTTVERHLERGLTRLRQKLAVEEEAR